MPIKKHHYMFYAGFTIIEMLTVITIMILLITIAIPGWRNFVQNNQAMAISSKLTGALSLARATAIQSGYNVVLCPTTYQTGTTCLNNPANWNSLILFIDINGNGTYEAGTDTLVKYYYDLPSGIIKVTSGNSPATFTPAGFYTPAAGITFTIKPTGCVGNNGRTITIMPSGNIQANFTSCP